MKTTFNNATNIEEFKSALLVFAKNEMIKLHNAILDKDDDIIYEVKQDLASLCDYLDPRFSEDEIIYNEAVDNVKNNIHRLFSKYYQKIMFDSTGTWGVSERADLVDYCKEHIEEFKEFCKEYLSEPDESCGALTPICDLVLPDIAENITKTKVPENAKSYFKNVINASKQLAEIIVHPENIIWTNCNLWLNYFKGTEGIDYYKDFKDYKEYLKNNYISWCPNTEDDPNPTYEEFVKEKNYLV